VFERNRDIPRAYTVPELDPDSADRLAIEWALKQRAESGQRILLLGPTQRAFRSRHPHIDALVQRGVQKATWRTYSGWDGIVIALWPNQKHLADIDDNWGTAAVVAVTWNEHEVLPWAAAKGAQALGGAGLAVEALDPVIAAAVRSMGAGHNQNNVLDQRARARIASCLLELRRNGFPLDPDALYTQALATGWRGDNAAGLRVIVNTLNAGRSVKGMRESSIRGSLIDHWREEAAKADGHDQD